MCLKRGMEYLIGQTRNSIQIWRNRADYHMKKDHRIAPVGWEAKNKIEACLKKVTFYEKKLARLIESAERIANR